jgi:hypothetical protein
MVLAYSGGLSTQQQKKERSRKVKDVERAYEEEYRQVIKKLGERIKGTKGDVQEQLKALKKRCQEEREVLSQEAEREFEKAVERLKKRRAEFLRLVQQEHRADLKKIDNARREKIKELNEQARAEMNQERTAWPNILTGHRIAAKEEFEQFLKAAREERAGKLRVLRAECIARGTSALSEARERLTSLEKEREERRGDKRFTQQYKAAGKKLPKQDAAKRRKERAQESDDEVRSNIPAELVPIFEMIKSQVKGTDRLSRTEAFLKMYEEDSGNLDALLHQKQERELAKQLAKWAAEQAAVDTPPKTRRSRSHKEILEEQREEAAERLEAQNPGLAKWEEERQAQNVFLAAERIRAEQEAKEKERKDRRKAAKKVQTQFTTKSGTELAGKKSRQRSILDDEPTERFLRSPRAVLEEEDHGDAWLAPGTTYDPAAEDVFGVPL